MRIESKVLEGKQVRLEPLEPRHHDALKRACEADMEVWDLYPFRMTGEHFEVWANAVAKRVARGDTLAFAVLLHGELVGVSLYSTIDAPNRRVEIGNTYYRPEARGGVVNPEAKLLMMEHAFGSGTLCVQFRVDTLNARSRAAVLKLGAKQDGILRRDRITWTGRMRDTVVFSVLDDEWPQVRAGLLARVNEAA